MLMPKKVKFRKQQRGRRRGLATRGGDLSFGDYGLQALEPRRGSGAHAAARHDRVMTCRPHGLGEHVEVRDPLGEYQAMTAAGARSRDAKPPPPLRLR